MDSNATQTGDIWRTSFTARVIVSVIFGSIIPIGIIGNMLVISLIVLVKKLHSVVNLCLGCLAVVDLMVLVFLPILPWLYLYDMGHSSLGRSFCFFLSCMDRPVLVCSVLISLLIGVERYTLVCHPLKSMGWWTWKKVCLALVVIFVVSVGAAVPYGFFTGYQKVVMSDNTTRAFCYLSQRNNLVVHYELVLSCAAFFLPIPLLIWLYGKMIMSLKTKVPQRNDAQGGGGRGAAKSRSQVALMLVVVLTVFIICNLPRHIYTVLHFCTPQVISLMNSKTQFIVNWLLRILLYVNHASNPVVYFLMTDSFRQAFKSVFCRCRTVNQSYGG